MKTKNKLTIDTTVVLSFLLCLLLFAPINVSSTWISTILPTHCPPLCQATHGLVDSGLLTFGLEASSSAASRLTAFQFGSACWWFQVQWWPAQWFCPGWLCGIRFCCGGSAAVGFKVVGSVATGLVAVSFKPSVTSPWHFWTHQYQQDRRIQCCQTQCRESSGFIWYCFWQTWQSTNCNN